MRLRLISVIFCLKKMSFQATRSVTNESISVIDRVMALFLSGIKLDDQIVARFNTTSAFLKRLGWPKSLKHLLLASGVSERCLMSANIIPSRTRLSFEQSLSQMRFGEIHFQETLQNFLTWMLCRIIMASDVVHWHCIGNVSAIKNRSSLNSTESGPHERLWRHSWNEVQSVHGGDA